MATTLQVLPYIVRGFLSSHPSHSHAHTGGRGSGPGQAVRAGLVLVGQGTLNKAQETDTGAGPYESLAHGLLTCWERVSSDEGEAGLLVMVSVADFLGVSRWWKQG